MATSVVSSSSAASTNLTDANGLTINAPASIASGDFLVAVLSAPYTGSVNWTPPSGWTLAASDHSPTVSLESRVYTRTAGGSEPSSYTWSTTLGGGSYAGVITAFRGTTGLNSVTGANPNDVVMTTTNPRQEPGTTSPVWPGLGTYAISWHATGSTGMSSTGNIGTERGDVSSTDGSPSTHERGCAVYTHGSAHPAGSYGSLGIATMNHAPTASIIWAIDLADSGVVLGASTMPHFTSSGLASRTVRFTDGASTMPRFTSAGTAGRAGPLVELLINGTWTDVTSYIRYADGITVTRGRSSEGSTMSTSMCMFTLDNRYETTSNRFSLLNVNGPYYGYIGRNTQIRVSKLEGSYRFWGEVSAWTPGADDTNNDQYVKLECSGITRRLDATTAPLFPAIQREVMAASPAALAYWPCNEPDGSTSFASPLVGVQSLGISGGTPDFGDYSSLKAAGSIPQVNTSSWRTPVVQGTSLSTGVTTAFLLASPGGITNSTKLLRVDFQYIPTGVLYPWAELTYSSTNELTLSMFQLSNSAGSITGTVPIVGQTGVMVYVAFGIDGSGHIKFGLWYQHETDATPVLVGTSYWAPGAGDTVGNQIALTFNPNNVALSDNSAAYMGQIAVWSGYAPASSHEYVSVGAYAGEAAGDRFLRICTEEGIPAVCNNSSNGTPMGPQLAKTTIDLIRECEASDMGILAETRSSFGLQYTVRRDLYNQDADLVLDYSEGALSSQLQPTYDDKGVQNDVIVQRDGGSSARYEIDSGPLSVNSPPLGIGRYTSSVTTSLADDFDCYAQAGWRAHISAVDEERITSVGVALENRRIAVDHDLTLDVLSVDSGSRLQITNTPSWIQEVDQIVQGLSERFDNQTHQITYNTSSATPYSTAVVPSVTTNTTAKCDSLTSTLGADIDDDDTSLSVAVTGVLWRVSASSAFDIIVGGEQMSVTAVSGTSSPQTFTVTRSVNGITKAHSAGDQVRLYKPAYIAL